ncbi:hypothetical protein [Parvicella tangerina]|uniref:Transporter n=1 Tax=Parvicella tangerina TaxID=2829795 RepID=A0A916JKP4_9FLAO|nr:hypothetical protein [Parvicella tangerina]CAG5078746.1 hypothetical protein CRYO30217_00756 [Parvicella tangerina]
MKKIIFVVLLLNSMSGWACDNCNVYLGINPNDFYHNIGLRFRARFHAGSFDNAGVLMLKHGGVEPILRNSTIKETYQRLELTGKYFWSPKLNTQVILPYVQNTQEIDQSLEYFVRGVGDVLLIQNYMLFNTKAYSDSLVFKHRLTLGVGVKIPTGRTDIERPKGTPGIDLQPGTGSWDGLFSMTYSAMYRKLGVMINGNFKANSSNNDGFQYGHTINATSSLFYLFRLNEKMQLMPSVGIYTEHFDHDYFDGELQEDSGGNLWMVNSGISWYVGKFNVRFDYQLALTNKLVNKQQIPTKTRYNVGVYYNF